ncbi:MAG: 5'/3'-nucleotidase SurE [Acidimicrobiia bacterium]|nr:5'/3'-nucleotidase SurE [Acidimicrobiia bacterium]
MIRSARLLALAALMALAASGCFFLPSTARQQAADPGSLRWWCTASNLPDLDASDCRRESGQLDVALGAAYRYPHAADAKAAGATAHAYAAGIGARFVFAAPHAFSFGDPDTLLYTGTAGTAQLAGLEWNVPGTAAPAGFAGSHDRWTQGTAGVWTLRVWIVRPFERQDDVFATSHPCLASTGPVFSLTAACSTSTHPQPLQILVTNDDGYDAPGIDAVVEGLRGLPGVQVSVIAPLENQSGAGGQTTDGPLSASSRHTLSGYPVTAVDGYPADSVIYAIRDLHLNPDLVVSGLNAGQNLGPVVNVSGTVGAARRGTRYFIPALASSQGFGAGGAPEDYPTGVQAVLAWVRDFRLGRAGPPFQTVANLNVPTCAAGSSPRGTVLVPPAAALDGRHYGPSDCTSTQTKPADDVDGFDWGYITLSDVGAG